MAVADIDPYRARSTAERWNIEDWYPDHKKIINRKDIDIVDLVLPHNLHTPIAVEAAEAEKHIMVEKPVANTLEEVDTMLETAEKARVKLMVSEFWRFCPIHKKVKKAIDKGYIGDIVTIRSEHCNYTEQIEHPHSWALDKKNLAYGVMGSAACHAISFVRMLCGEAESVFAMDSTVGQPELFRFDKEIELNAVTLIRFKNGVMGEVYGSATAKDYFHYKTWIWGTKGTLIVDMVTSELNLYSEVLEDYKMEILY